MRTRSSLFMFFVLSLGIACGRSDAQPDPAPPAPPSPLGDLGAEKSTGPASAHFIYCASHDLEAGVDFGTAVLGTGTDALKGKAGNRLPGAPAFATCTLNSISKVSISGTDSFGIVCADGNGKLFVYSVSTTDYITAQLNFSDWDHTFEKNANCQIYNANPFAGTEAWP